MVIQIHSTTSSTTTFTHRPHRWWHHSILPSCHRSISISIPSFLVWSPNKHHHTCTLLVVCVLSSKKKNARSITPPSIIHHVPIRDPHIGGWMMLFGVYLQQPPPSLAPAASTCLKSRSGIVPPSALPEPASDANAAFTRAWKAVSTFVASFALVS